MAAMTGAGAIGKFMEFHPSRMMLDTGLEISAHREDLIGINKAQLQQLIQLNGSGDEIKSILQDLKPTGQHQPHEANPAHMTKPAAIKTRN